MQNRSLKNHLMRHSGERPYQCNKCDQSFIQQVALKKHLKHFHSEKNQKRIEERKRRKLEKISSKEKTRNERPDFVVCPICLKTVKNENFHQHEEIHKETKYDCQFCGKTFTQTGSLKRHIVQIHGVAEKPVKNLIVKSVVKHLIPGNR